MKGFFSGNFLANRQEIVSVHGGTWCTILFPASVHSIFLTVKDLFSKGPVIYPWKRAGNRKEPENTKIIAKSD
ncbi:hypothetical protein DSECCO2_600540 [anaerobic digester metagenome]|jgi:hypothetical protein|uniref:Uncharacterized protein n=2 Tax=Methanosarcina mazei TaxID=2209 RepID=A0A0E3RBN9_METMZ|nr:hypothetical protein MSMAS_0019 [Methanosarcina mazei S-6]AKB66564.1 hypothetical protein MSMAL_0021 [Methanosarcina mazei LYC]WIM44521.1 hypothetical protein PSF70_06910 [Methanosarcina mazei]